MTDDPTKLTVKAGSATPDFVGGEKPLFSLPSLEELGIYRKADRNRAKRARRKARGKR